MKIYVGNLSLQTDQPVIRLAFEEYGEVGRVTLAVGKADRVRKGFGFVEMPSEDEALAAIEALNGQELGGNAVQVSIARPGTYRA